MNKYTERKNVLILIALLKGHGIKKIVISPGTTNMMFVASVQQDSWFEIFSAADERSAAYIACGLAHESGEPVVLSCTGATASRNYFPGLTEAYYRKLPVLAVTSMLGTDLPGQHMPQVLDRTVVPNDAVKLSVSLPEINNEDDEWKCNLLTNQAILALSKDGGGPVHINLVASFSYNFSIEELPKTRIIRRLLPGEQLPEISREKTVAVFAGSHPYWSSSETETLDEFCEKYNAFVLCDHTSGYRGKYRVLSALLGAQEQLKYEDYTIDLLIDIGEVSGDYYALPAREIWRVSPDGELRDRFKKMTKVFEMPEKQFFESYVNAATDQEKTTSNYERFMEKIAEVRSEIPKLPFSNIWTAQQLAGKLPENSVVHFGILNSLRAWNFFEFSDTIRSSCNVGGFGIDGCLSTLIGASLANQDKKYFAIVGDLAFFYDMNSLGNRHVGKNIRILLVNNGRGTEFRHYSHPASILKEDADLFVAAAGHYGNQSSNLVRHYAEDLGFEYFSASDKEEFLKAAGRFVTEEDTDRPMIFEVFTDSALESEALSMIRNIEKNVSIKQYIKQKIGTQNIELIKSKLKRN